MSLRDLVIALREERDLLVTRIFKDFAEAERLLTRAFDEHAAGNLPEARILLNEAVDREFGATGDAKILSDLTEEWEVDYERDQRSPDPPAKPMKCPLCPAHMERTEYTHVTTVGSHTVTHEAALAWVCPACGGCSLSSAELFGYERAAALRLLRMPGPVSGEVLKFARKVLGLRCSELDKQLGFPDGQVDFFEHRPIVVRHVGLSLLALIQDMGSNPPAAP